MADPALLHGWGRTAPTAAAATTDPASLEEVRAAVLAAPPRGIVARGAGRSYGDAAQNAGGAVLRTDRLDAISDVDASGLVTCGAGVRLQALLAHLAGSGWALPVLPGTAAVSVGGAVAFDVHGKNHPRAGTFADHVSRIELIDGTGGRRVLVPADPLFAATAGGLGHTGVITSVELRLRRAASSALLVDTHRTACLDDTVALLEPDDGPEYRVAWLDTLHPRCRGIVTTADPAPEPDGEEQSWPAAARLRAPGWAPRRLLTRRRIALFNAAYFRHAPVERLRRRVAAASTHAPLDAVDGWNRLYGSDGFVQYQLAVPDIGAVRCALTLLRERQVPAFLAVLKRFGATTAPPAAARPLSFPLPGWTLALDLPADPAIAPALDRLDELVADAGGRVYLAKDSRLRPGLLARMYPGLADWRAVRAQADPHRVFRSDLSRRLSL